MEDGMDESQVLATVAWVMDRQLPTTHYHRPQGLGGQSSWRRLDMFHKGLNLEWGHYPLPTTGSWLALPTTHRPMTPAEITANNEDTAQGKEVKFR